MTAPISGTVAAETGPALCGKGTHNGQAAIDAKYGFAACVLPLDHRPPCDSGTSQPGLSDDQ